MEKNVLSRSPHIALYPSLLKGSAGRWSCAWYEYSSATEPAPSDIWIAHSADGNQWGEPIKVSGGVSYNNGPSLQQTPRGLLLAWHSWRPPGKEPFQLGGDINNIWFSQSADGQKWSAPWMAFPKRKNTEYASLASDAHQGLWLAFFHRDTNEIQLSRSLDQGRTWEEPWVVAPSPSKTPDLCFHNEHLYLTYITQGALRIARSRDGDARHWETFFELPGAYQRPKINGLGDQLYLTTHSTAWGSFRRKWRLQLEENTLKLRIKPSNRAGDQFWALNALQMRGTSGEENVRFGPAPESGKEEIVVTATSPLYGTAGNPSYGFDHPVQEKLRLHGSPITRSLVCADEPRVFSWKKEPGIYELELTYSSWVSPTPAPDFQLNGKILAEEATTPELEHCLLLELSLQGQLLSETVFPLGAEGNQNRPSKVMGASTAEARVAWTSFGQERVQTMIAPLATLRQG